MSGVIDPDGTQWEHCNVCGKWVRLDDLGYEPPTPAHTCGRDICLQCTNAHPNIDSIRPSRNWIPQHSS